MADYKAMYTKLFNAITDVTRTLQNAQVGTEEIFLSQKESEIIALDRPDE